MPDIAITITNLGQIRGAFRQAPRVMAKNLNIAIRKSVFVVERESKIRTPVRTGRLRASHEVRFGNLTGEVGPTASYAIYVHEGTHFMKGRPFLYQGVVAAEDAVNGYFLAAVNATLDEIAADTR